MNGIGKLVEKVMPSVAGLWIVAGLVAGVSAIADMFDPLYLEIISLLPFVAEKALDDGTEREIATLILAAPIIGAISWAGPRLVIRPNVPLHAAEALLLVLIPVSILALVLPFPQGSNRRAIELQSIAVSTVRFEMGIAADARSDSQIEAALRGPSPWTAWNTLRQAGCKREYCAFETGKWLIEGARERLAQADALETIREGRTSLVVWFISLLVAIGAFYSWLRGREQSDSTTTRHAHIY